MATEQRETREQRIKRERVEMNIRPWQFAPSAVFLGDNPWQGDTSAAGFTSWQTAQRQREEIHARNPDYFWDDNDDLPNPKGK